MKKFCLIMSFILVLTCFVSCSKKEQEEPQKNIEPKATQMQAICELATMECYYHNVAKYFEEGVEGWGPWEKDRKFWIEYDGVVTLGVDTTSIEMQIDDNIVYITEPKPIIVDVKVDENSLNKDSFYIDVNSAEVTSKHEQQAFKEAQSKMRESAENDKTLLANAKQRAQSLLEDYVQNIGSAVGKQYEVKWVDSLDEVNTTIQPTSSQNTVA